MHYCPKCDYEVDTYVKQIKEANKRRKYANCI